MLSRLIWEGRRGSQMINGVALKVLLYRTLFFFDGKLADT